MKLRTRLSLSHAAVVALTLLACLLIFAQAAGWMLAREAGQRQAQRLADLSRAAREAVLRQETLGLVHHLRGLLQDQTLVYAAFSDPASGIAVAAPSKFRGEAAGSAPGAAAHALRRLQDGTEALVWRSPVAGTRAWVEMAYSTGLIAAQARERTRQWVFLAAGVLLAGLVAGLLMAWLMARGLARPLQEIGRSTRLVQEGSAEALVSVDRDDEIGDLARAFNAMVLKLRELEEMKRDFVAGVTHDFGSPLHAIRTTIEHLLSGGAGRLEGRQAEYLLMISNNLESLTAFVDKLLTVARIEAAKVEPYPEPVDVAAHVTELLRLYEAEAAKRGIGLKVTRRSPYVSLVADLTMFRQIVMNLLSNAVKYTEKGSVEVVLGEEGGDTLIEVRDTGIGIAPEHHGLIFDKFFRVRQGAAEAAGRGNGLGLAIVKGLVEAQGGSVSVSSALSRGAVFTVRLPKDPRQPAPRNGEEGGA